jgi:hypothetical protein
MGYFYHLFQGYGVCAVWKPHLRVHRG